MASLKCAAEEHFRPPVPEADEAAQQLPVASMALPPIVRAFQAQVRAAIWRTRDRLVLENLCRVATKAIDIAGNIPCCLVCVVVIRVIYVFN